MLLVVILIRAYLSFYQVPAEWLEKIVDTLGLLLGMAVAYFFKNDK
jgi:hypothetical protein